MIRERSIEGRTSDVHPKLLADLVNQTPRVAIATVLLSLIYIGIFYQFVPPLLLSIWFFLQMVSTAYRLHNAREFKRSLKQADLHWTRRNQTQFMLFSIIQASLWVCSSLLVVRYAPQPYEMISLVIAIGVINAAALSMSSIYRAYLVFFFMIIIPQMIIMTMYGEPHHLGLLMVVAIAIPATLILSKSIHQSRLSIIATHDELEDSVRKLHELSISDNLTDAYNRRYFFEASEDLIADARKDQHKAALIMLDVDHFKRINDTHGHQAGDFVLVKLAEAIRSTLRDSDIFARIGGEEFSIFLNHTSLEGAGVVAEKIRTLVENMTFDYESTPIRVTVSIGISELDHQKRTADDLYKASDRNLYAAKESGRNRVVL